MKPNRGGRKKKIKNWVILVIVLAAIALIALHPIGLSIIIWLLPMGSGFDDVIAIAAIVIALVILFFKFNNPKSSRKISASIKDWLNR